ncbi:uncharacterized protein LOC110228440 [Arabidopsis lyrata subsp. lyrata]|uniref:uncharacterized protein LOC110228440 n=1 Tax=Arabidopsis lyrata subsp. lyrata TaxID=81972 RepID=UPI000A29AAF3|nr:uncharacterized protein LOC110228440 [Arabidopsis lyrata subsp. lyrata]|eukprot:XP_020881656.1 uncharacterized protein LOC110228440 [Arabidopsis lyrata subsp. lyrata]
MRLNLIRNRNFWELNPATSGSWIWRSLCKLRMCARPFLVCDIGSGITASFWHDNWTDYGPLIDLVGPLGPRVTGLPTNAVVRDALRGRSWWISSSRSRNPVITLLRNLLPSPENMVDCEQDDTYLWKPDQNAPSNRFSTAKTWLALNPISPIIPWHKSVWFKDRIPKHAFICWVVAWNRLPTRDRLRSWNMVVPSACVLCSSHDESRDHLFFRCAFSSGIWSYYTRKANLTPPSQFMDCLIWLQTASRERNVSYIPKLLFQASIYAIWRERNSRIHSDSNRSSQSIIKEINLTIRARLDPLSRARRPSSSLGSLLSSWFGVFQTRGASL